MHRPTLDIAPLRSESQPQKRSGMARVLKGFHSFTCTPTRSSAIGLSHTCLCLPSRSWYSFTDLGGMEGWVDRGAKYPRLRFEPATSRLQIRHSTTQPQAHPKRSNIKEDLPAWRLTMDTRSPCGNLLRTGSLAIEAEPRTNVDAIGSSAYGKKRGKQWRILDILTNSSK